MARRICLACQTSIFVLLLSFYLPRCFARDTITLNDSIRDGETIISAQQKFELGFFTPGNGNNDPGRYVGIWYYSSNPKTIVWVANRDSPLHNKNGVFGVAEDGNLALFDESKKRVWETKLEGWVSFKGKLQLLDSGNLVLSKEDEEGRSSRFIWESFKNPTNTFLPGMKMDENLILVSWASPDNPRQGDFRFQLEEGRRYIIRKERSTYHWKSGVSGEFISDNILPIVSSLLSNSDGSALDPRKLIRTSFNRTNMRLVMNTDGKVQYFTRLNESAPWVLKWWEPSDPCHVFRACEKFEGCRSKNSSFKMCECLPRFEPDSSNFGDFSEGCKRKMPLCGSKNITDFSPLNVTQVENADLRFGVNNETDCKEECLKKCNCQAYSYKMSEVRGVIGDATCWIWSVVNNIQLNDRDVKAIIYLRVQQSLAAEPSHTNQDEDIYVTSKQFKQWPLAFAVTVASVTALSFIIFYIYTRKANFKNQEDRRSDLPLRFYDGQRYVKELMDSGGLVDEEKKGIDLPFFDFESILAATDNFSEANKLGKGGFGPVYKGKFPGGQEIAVKRLSKVSGQGIEEFKNEVVLIAKLQHRNLVRLLGYCIQGDEKILLYEFMSNKSLDFFIFDSNFSELLDWEMRYNIILGIARGLLYLHQDSRLRIIHRDLKTSNILLDEEMNPKISDFGLARMFKGKQTGGTTTRVVGTYGYMSPEYALDGFFSIKSDVFSFGVIILEIVSGKKNTGFYDSQKALSLLGYAWSLWQEDKALDIMDQKLSASSKTRIHDVLKFINVGLLCVQEDPDDRPTISDVVILLSSATASLPTPKRPAFVLRRALYSMASSSSSKTGTNNEITVSLEGR